MKFLVFIISLFISVLIIMKCASLLNKGSVIIPIFGIIGIYLIIYINIKTKLFTNFNFKNRLKK